MNILFLKAPTPTGANASQAQLEAGNYKKAHKTIQGLRVTIENPKGSVRRGADRNGHEWVTKMHCAYGYIKDSMGVDGDQVDVYIGPDEDAEFVYVVHQRKAGDWKKYDEDKVMLQFSTEAKAKAAYLRQYDDKRFLGPITKMSVDEFKEKVLATKDKPAMIKGQSVVFLKSDSGKPVVCLDFDGVLHSYSSGWKGNDVIPDPPIDGAKKAVDTLRKRYKVVVNSARCMNRKGRKAVEAFLDEHNIVVDEVSEHKPAAIAYVDDLGVPFQGDWDKVINRIDELGDA